MLVMVLILIFVSCMLVFGRMLFVVWKLVVRVVVLVCVGFSLVDCVV